METKYTKGNWIARQVIEEDLISTMPDGQTFTHNNISICKEDFRSIAEVRYATDIKNGGWGTVSDKGEFFANAKLIASAPVLLEALLQVKSYLGEDKDNWLEGEFMLSHTVELAIQKAIS